MVDGLQRIMETYWPVVSIFGLCMLLVSLKARHH